LIEARMMHRLIRLLSLLVVLFGVGLLWCASSNADPQLPPLTGRVVDQAGLLDDGALQRLTGELAQYEAKTSTQIVVVTLPDLQGYPIEQWGLALLRGWQIGQKGKNNGVVLVVAPKDRELRIETGYGVEGPLTDATSDAIIRHVIAPHFQQNDYSGGIFAGVASIEAALEGSFSAPATESATGRSWPWPALLIALLWLVIVLFNVFRQFGPGGTRLYTRQRRDPYWGGGWNSPGGFGGGGFGGGGGGGFGGGGGTGGGGGASGRW
jgi:uncharacterized protein